MAISRQLAIERPASSDARTSDLQEGSTASRALAVWSLLGGVALAVVVGAASAATPWRRAPIGASFPAWAVEVLVASGSVLVAIGVMVAWIGTPGTIRDRRKRRRSAATADERASAVRGAWVGLRLLAVGLAIFGAVCLLAWPLLTPPRSDVGSAGPPASEPAPGPSRDVTTPGSSPASPMWFLLPAVAVFVVLAPAAIVLRRRRWRGTGDEARIPTDAAPRRRPTIEDVRLERDPRSAILQAYAAVESMFEEIGLTRPRGETASDFLERVVRRLPPAAVATTALTAGFEEARYSDHAISGHARGAAIAALEEIDSLLGERE